MKKLLFATLVLGITAVAAQATVSVSVNVFALNDQANNAPAIPSKTIAVVDRDGDGLAGFGDLQNLDPANFLNDADDWIIADAFNAAVPDGPWNEATGDDASEFGFTEFLVTPNYVFDLNANGLQAGDEVFLFWFPNLSLAATAPGADQPVGIISLGVLPGDSGTLSFSNQTNPNSQALYKTAPEPASVALLGLGGLLVARRRRA